MSILFCAVARGTQVLAQWATCVGNFKEVTDQILKMIPDRDEKRSYTSDKYLFHYVAENAYVYFCITDDKVPRSRTFLFLNEIQRKFLASFEDTPPAAIPYAAITHPSNGVFTRVLESEMTRYNDCKTTRIKADLDELKSLMVQNVDRMALRGERLESLINRTDDLAANTTTFKCSSVKVKRKLQWQYVKVCFMTAIASGLAVYFIGVIACGGFAWHDCIG